MTREIHIAMYYITQPGLIGRIIKELPSRITVEITDVFFPVHSKSWGNVQIRKHNQAYSREFFTGQVHIFWKTGTRAGFEVGGNMRLLDDWDWEIIKERIDDAEAGLIEIYDPFIRKESL